VTKPSRSLLTSIATLAGAILVTLAAIRQCLAVQSTTPVDTQAPADAAQAWPQTISTQDATVVIYLPQVETFERDRVTGRAAVSVTRAGTTEPTFGAMQFSAEISTDRESRTVTLIELSVTASQFRSADAELGKVLSETVKNGVRQADMTFSLDGLLTQLEIATREKTSVDEMKNDPPKIVVSDVPAILVLYDGPPKSMSLDNSSLMRIVNTPFLVLFDPSTKLYYLDGGRGWYSAPDPLGPWQVTDQVSKEILAIQEKAKQPADNPPATQPEADDNSPAPKVYTATDPTELIVTDGPPQMASIYNTNLLYVSNTESDVFLDIMTQKVYVLLAGRWYVADRQDGPWAYVASDKLPADFAKIPPESPKADVLPNVAGTELAEESVLDALIPQTATVERSAAGPTVTYDGQPQFESIQQSTVSYAVNTPDSVLRVDGGYYCCSQGVWYQSTAPAGPWIVCVSVPGAIYTIPPSCPVYPVRYVYVYNYSPTVVYVGYTPGYMGCYVYRGTVIYGTGYVYRGWAGRYYYPRPVTYGFGVAYNPYTGNWGFRVGVAGPGYAVGVRWGGSSGWWGSGGYHQHNNVNIKTGDINIDRSKNINIGNGNVNINDRSRNIYSNRPDNGKGVSTRDRPQGRAPSDMRARPSDARPANQDRANNRAGGQPRANTLPAQSDRNLFADKNGNVVRRGMDGWETRDRTNAQRSGNQPDSARRQQVQQQTQNQRQQRPDLDRQLQARDRGQQRSQNYQQYRSQTQNPGSPTRSPQNTPNAPNRSAPQRGAGQRGNR
jgi:hypothetical protein